jgi:dCMP deaminase
MNDAACFSLACQAATQSTCLSKHIGAVIIKDGKVIGHGANGPPKGVSLCQERWVKDPYLTEIRDILDDCPKMSLGYASGQGLSVCPAVHAEQSAIHNTYQNGKDPKDATMFVTCGVPCVRCFASILDAGISEVVVNGMHFYDEGSKWLMLDSGLFVREYTKYPEAEC